ncbi:MAG: hypothetical protein WCC87_04410 [Candidatus Korobacteraceae bacterium]
MRRIDTPDLIQILRRTLSDLEQSEHPGSPALLELKRSLLRSIAELERAHSDDNEKSA